MIEITSYVSVCCWYSLLNETAPTDTYTLSLHDALPIWLRRGASRRVIVNACRARLSSPRFTCWCGRDASLSLSLFPSLSLSLYLSLSSFLAHTLRASREQIGRASCRERVQISVVAGSLKKKKEKKRYLEENLN